MINYLISTLLEHIKEYDLLVKFLYESDRKVGTFLLLQHLVFQ